jgi:hypothetical protein
VVGGADHALLLHPLDDARGAVPGPAMEARQRQLPTAAALPLKLH